MTQANPTVADALEALGDLAPESLAEPWDRVGLHVGSTDTPASAALLAIDLTPAVVREAVDANAGIVVAYHPPIFQPLTRLTPETPLQRALIDAVRGGLAVYSPHTALDAATDGINDWLARAFTDGDPRAQVRPIRPTPSDKRFKLVAFVPPSHTDAVRDALAHAGAGRIGHIGHYSHCSFTTPGTGTFKGDETTNPAVGQRGRLERVPEQRLEMIVPGDELPAALAALREAHPYEEPAFDIFALDTTADPVRPSGAGRMVTLSEPRSLCWAVDAVKRHLGLDRVKVADPADRLRSDIDAGGGEPMVQRIALCPGAGGSLAEEAAAAAGAAGGGVDLWLTGEMRHHDLIALTQAGTAVILPGHTQTERPYLPVLRDRLSQRCPAVDWRVSRCDVHPTRIA